MAPKSIASVALTIIAVLNGCASPAARIDRLAARSHFERTIVPGTAFQHVVYLSQPPDARPDPFFIYIDGDGRPFSADGTRVRDDPTSLYPLALELLHAVPVRGAYVARPCYQLMESPCTPLDWTNGRYSETVVASMTAVIASVASSAHAKHVVLVGYSGGGPLALLAAERLDGVAAVVTLSGNIDVSAWAESEDYTPLADSLDPAQSTHPHPWLELHLQGTADDVVPPSSTNAYFRRYPKAERRSFRDFDHSCCWLSTWPRIAREIIETVGKNNE
jgi:hypothetical protein